MKLPKLAKLQASGFMRSAKLEKLQCLREAHEASGLQTSDCELGVGQKSFVLQATSFQSFKSFKSCTLKREPNRVLPRRKAAEANNIRKSGASIRNKSLSINSLQHFRGCF